MIITFISKVNVNKGGEQEKFPNDISRVLNMQNINVILNKDDQKTSKKCNC
jgi:hypothetical protein